ncbi:hypothetical protein QYF61_000491 [Mycteria americana]|uniref:Hyaluronidase n=1 Tax=Mycteria americana TaxID=33587 RepID=A0AAN7NNI4_MYCAM|nr:hypothetical protein QYF61_000491 [Mycteria americana]
MKEKIALGMKSRPKGLWGYYLYPDCHNYNFCDQNCTGSCSKSEVLRNNELSWLWDSSAALYPSIGIKKSPGNIQNILHFSQFRVSESVRITSTTSQDYALPVFVYNRLAQVQSLKLAPCLGRGVSSLSYEVPLLPGHCHHPLPFPIRLLRAPSNLTLNVSRDGASINTIGVSALGAAGIAIWRNMNLTSSESNCTKMQKFVDSELGPYIINVSSSLHSRHLCQDNGRYKAKDEGVGAVRAGCSRRDGQLSVTPVWAMPSPKVQSHGCWTRQAEPGASNGAH